MTENFTSAVLVGLGLTTNFEQLKSTISNPSVLIIVCASLLMAKVGLSSKRLRRHLRSLTLEVMSIIKLILGVILSTDMSESNYNLNS
ncbi:MAG: hypothetical protein Q8853_02815, partial [Candidatus Phytoplasma australasiaticum]|nr:hypothetical protein [Candidatus Phytoplasma australasiaticum]